MPSPTHLPLRPAQTRPRRSFTTRPNLAAAETIEDLREIALRNLPRFSAEYLEGGAEEERTLALNRSAFDDYTFAPRVLRDISKRDVSRAIFARPSALPFAIAPTGFNGLLWPEGDTMLARAAAKAGIPYGQSTVSNTSLADIGRIPNIRHWFQLYLYGGDAVWEKLIADADAAGCEALLVTVDTPILGNREWDRRNFIPGPKRDLSLVSKAGLLCHPTWLWNVLMKNGWPRFYNLEQFIPAGQPRDLFAIGAWANANARADLNWEHIARIRKIWPKKLLIKGVQHVEDVRLAVDAGLDGVVLSNHGGRQIDRGVASIQLVRASRAVAGPKFTILADSGFRRGSEIVQALALGADAVLCGRAMLYGLAAGGEAGVTRAIEILRAEIDRTLGLLGVTSIGQLSPDIFLQPSPVQRVGGPVA